MPAVVLTGKNCATPTQEEVVASNSVPPAVTSMLTGLSVQFFLVS